VRHGRSICLHEHVVDEEDADVQVHDPRKLFCPFGLRVTCGQKRERILCGPPLGKNEIRALLGRNVRLPLIVSFHDRQAGASGESLRLPVECARLRAGAGQAVDEWAHACREPSDERREAVPDVIVVTAEELVAAFA
jgi:hypothetical protein